MASRVEMRNIKDAIRNRLVGGFRIEEHPYIKVSDGDAYSAQYFPVDGQSFYIKVQVDGSWHYLLITISEKQ